MLLTNYFKDLQQSEMENGRRAATHQPTGSAVNQPPYVVYSVGNTAAGGPQNVVMAGTTAGCPQGMQHPPYVNQRTFDSPPSYAQANPGFSDD